MEFILETHKYAPEMNRIHFLKGGSLSTPHCTSIRQVRQEYFNKVRKGIHVTIKSQYEEDCFKRLDRLVGAGYVTSRKYALEFSRQFKQKGGLLLDGSTLPPNKVTLKFKIIG